MAGLVPAFFILAVDRNQIERGKMALFFLVTKRPLEVFPEFNGQETNFQLEGREA
jgi:hypothetical protein